MTLCPSKQITNIDSTTKNYKIYFSKITYYHDNNNHRHNLFVQYMAAARFRTTKISNHCFDKREHFDLCKSSKRNTHIRYKENVLSPPRYSGAFYPHHCNEEQTNQTYNISENKQIRCCYKMGKNAEEALLLEIIRRLSRGYKTHLSV